MDKKGVLEQPWLQWLFIFTNTEFIVYINLDYNMKGTLGFFLASVSTAFDRVYCFILLILLMKWPPPPPPSWPPSQYLGSAVTPAQ